MITDYKTILRFSEKLSEYVSKNTKHWPY